MLKLNEPFRNRDILDHLSFFANAKKGFECKKELFFFNILLIFYSVDPQIFANPDPDPGSQNVADLTNQDPKH